MNLIARVQGLVERVWRFFFPMTDWFSIYEAATVKGQIAWHNKTPSGGIVSTVPFPLAWHVMEWTDTPPGYRLLSAQNPKTGALIPPEHALRCVRCGAVVDDREIPLKHSADQPICGWCRPIVKFRSFYS
jgi:hypothetical protein